MYTDGHFSKSMDADRDPLPDTEPDLKVNTFEGALVKRRYRIEKQIGRGGFAITYLASDTQLHARPVVVKVLLDYHAEDPAILKKFRQELEALARINHPGVVGPLDYGALDDGRPFLVMEFIQGVRLRDVMGTQGMELGRAARIIQQIGRALNAAHQQGILHRDVKPENIMLQNPGQEDEQAKLIDFGISNVRDSQVTGAAPSSRIFGTPAYMPPEQFEGVPFSPAGDIYALGVVAYEMVTGRHPFNAETDAHLMRLKLDGVRVKPRGLRPSLPEPAEECILKALSVHPEDRFPSAREFGQAFARSLAGDSGGRRGRPRAGVDDEQHLELAHVVFLDLVRHSLLYTDHQKRDIDLLDRLVRETPEFRKGEANERLIIRPTGDGVALVFFGDPVQAVACAVSIAKSIENHDLKVRIGLNTGLVVRRTDINGDPNVSGDGIAKAERVMSCGDGGQILLSRSIAEVISQLADWAPRLRDLGEREVKNGVRIHIFGLLPDGVAGTPEVQTAVDAATPQTEPVIEPENKIAAARRWIPILIGCVVLMVAGAAGLWRWLGTRAPVATQERGAARATGPAASPQVDSAVPASRPAAPDKVTSAPTPPLFTLEDWLKYGWKRDGAAIARQGGEFVLVPLDLTRATVQFTVSLIKGKRIEWVAGYRDAKNYCLFQIDESGFSRTAIVNGKPANTVKTSYAAKRRAYDTFAVRITPQGVVNAIRSEPQWETLDDWQPAGGVSTGRFGFHIPGRDQISLSEFRITQE
jgi:serine/threonine protein kinase